MCMQAPDLQVKTLGTAAPKSTWYTSDWMYCNHKDSTFVRACSGIWKLSNKCCKFCLYLYVRTKCVSVWVVLSGYFLIIWSNAFYLVLCLACRSQLQWNETASHNINIIEQMLDMCIVKLRFVFHALCLTVLHQLCYDL